MAVTLNAKGTSYPSYTIGKRGVTIHQGTNTPIAPNTGDVWINPTDGTIKSYNGSEWVNLQQPFTHVTTAAYTAKAGERLAVNTGTNPIDITLPASPNAGDIVEFIDNGDFSTNNLTILRNGNPIDSIAEDVTVSDKNVHFWLQYKDGTVGWEVFGVIGGASSSSTVPATSPGPSYHRRQWIPLPDAFYLHS